MPLFSGKVANYLFNEIDGSYVAVPMWPNGRLETLLMVLERKSTLEIASVLCHLGRSHPDDIIRGALRALFVSPFGQVKALDPELKSFVNITSQQDLNRLEPRQGHGPVAENLRLNLGDLPVEVFPPLLKAASECDHSNFAVAAKMFADSADDLERQNLFFWVAVSREYEGKSLQHLYKLGTITEPLSRTENAFLKAAKNYELEAAIYEENRCFLLAQRANSDSAWCKAQTKKH
jgi:hypothetical protein